MEEQGGLLKQVQNGSKEQGKVTGLAFTVVWVGPVAEFLNAGSSFGAKEGSTQAFLSVCIDEVTEREG